VNDTRHTESAASLLRPFTLPAAIFGNGFIGMKREQYDKLRAVLQSIVDMDPEENEWDAVEKYSACQRLARDALSDEDVPK
jgi:hypothetical protein